MPPTKAAKWIRFVAQPSIMLHLGNQVRRCDVDEVAGAGRIVIRRRRPRRPGERALHGAPLGRLVRRGARTVAALKQEGFGVLTEIDVKSTLKSKLDREFRRYVILGACNPQLAHRALEAELGMGLLLPCNICVWEEDGGSVVSIARPEAMFQIVNREDVQPVAQEADERLRRVLGKISTAA